MPELKVGALTYGAFLSMVLPPPVVWKDCLLYTSNHRVCNFIDFLQ